MAKVKVLSFDEAPGQSASFGEERSRVRLFEAHVSDLMGAEDALYDYDRSLQYGAVHPTNKTLRVKSFSAKQASKAQKEGDQGWKFQISVSYSSTVPEPLKSPFSIKPEIDLNFVTERRIITEDYEGNLIVNKAGQLIEGVEDDVSLAVFSYRAPLPANFPEWVTEYPRAINSDIVTLRGLPCKPKTLQIGRFHIGPVLTWEDGTEYSMLEMDLVHNEKTWVRTLLNRGTMEIVVRDFQPVKGGYSTKRTRYLEPILDDQGKPVSEPQFLDNDGMVPRVDEKGKRISLKKQLKGEQSLNEDLLIKAPLSPRDIITLEYTLKKPLSFNKILSV